MKLSCGTSRYVGRSIFRRGRGGPPAKGGTANGSAVLVVLALLIIMEALIVCNSRTLDHLKRELKFIEEKQKQRFAPVLPKQKPLPIPAGPRNKQP